MKNIEIIVQIVKKNINDNIHKAKLKKYNDQTNSDNYKVAANSTEYHQEYQYHHIRIPIPESMMAIISCKK